MLKYGLCLWVFLWIGGVLLLLFPKKPGKLHQRLAGLRVETRNKIGKTTFFQRRKHQEVDREIGESISFLRNLLLLGTGRRMSRDFVISRLAKRDGFLKPGFLGMLSRLRVNQRQEAMEFFAAYAGTTRGKEFAGVLLQWDDLDPLALSEILLSHQKSIGEIRMTEKIRRDETISDLIYLPVVINVLVICVNFIFTSYYLKQQEMFQMLF
ncbi:MAG: hypothetical protein RBS51_01985 [Anaerovoracaceae bacterium]|jgi:hypothetical protein|nr:hypothetical protein [Anaerovoracaceae bacterium]